MHCSIFKVPFFVFSCCRFLQASLIIITHFPDFVKPFSKLFASFFFRFFQSFFVFFRSPLGKLDYYNTSFRFCQAFSSTFFKIFSICSLPLSRRLDYSTTSSPFCQYHFFLFLFYLFIPPFPSHFLGIIDRIPLLSALLLYFCLFFRAVFPCFSILFHCGSRKFRDFYFGFAVGFLMTKLQATVRKYSI